MNWFEKQKEAIKKIIEEEAIKIAKEFEQKTAADNDAILRAATYAERIALPLVDKKTIWGTFNFKQEGKDLSLLGSKAGNEICRIRFHSYWYPTLNVEVLRAEDTISYRNELAAYNLGFSQGVTGFIPFDTKEGSKSEMELAKYLMFFFKD